MFSGANSPLGQCSSTSVVVADSGHLTRIARWFPVVTLNKGRVLKGRRCLRDFASPTSRTIGRLLAIRPVALDERYRPDGHAHAVEYRQRSRSRRLHWRITLVFTVFMMALMVVPLQRGESTSGRVFVYVAPAMLLYLLFFPDRTSIKSNGGEQTGRLSGCGRST